MPLTYETNEKRRALHEALDRRNHEPILVAGNLWVFPRAGRNGAVAHLVNLAYNPDRDKVAPRRNVTVDLPKGLFGRIFGEAVQHSYGGAPQRLTPESSGEDIRITVPEMRIWSVEALR